MENAQADRAFFSDDVSRQLLEAQRELKSASALIGVIIQGELAGPTDQGVLERLYCAKARVTCAIEETEKHISRISLEESAR